MASPLQIKTIYALLGDNNLRDEKENIVEAFTSGKTKSVRAMSGAQAAALIGHLKSLDETDNRATKMRNKILSMAHEMGWETSATLPMAKKAVDMERLNNWCIKYGYLHKKIDDYTYNELPKLVSQFEGVYKDHLKQ